MLIKNQNGFGLIPLLFSLAVIAILIVVGMNVYANQQGYSTGESNEYNENDYLKIESSSKKK